MKTLYSKLLMIMIVLVSVSVASGLQAQSQQFSWHEFPTDTLTNAGTVALEFPRTVSDNSIYQFQITATNISGTSAGTVELQASSDEDGSIWTRVNSDTLVVVDGATKLFTGTAYGLKYRLLVTGSGTQSTSVKAFAVFKKTREY